MRLLHSLDLKPDSARRPLRVDGARQGRNTLDDLLAVEFLVRTSTSAALPMAPARGAPTFLRWMKIMGT